MDDAIKLMRDDLEEARQELLAAEFSQTADLAELNDLERKVERLLLELVAEPECGADLMLAVESPSEDSKAALAEEIKMSLGMAVYLAKEIKPK